jgi:hypothetical protein
VKDLSAKANGVVGDHRPTVPAAAPHAKPKQWDTPLPGNPDSSARPKSKGPRITLPGNPGD